MKSLKKSSRKAVHQKTNAKLNLDWIGKDIISGFGFEVKKENNRRKNKNNCCGDSRHDDYNYYEFGFTVESFDLPTVHSSPRLSIFLRSISKA